MNHIMNGLNLLVLRCRDLEVSRQFYECVGMRFSGHAHGSGPEHYASEESSGVFELYPAALEQTVDATGLGFATNEIEKRLGDFESRGFNPQPIRDRPWGRTFIVRDPDGRRVEIKEEGSTPQVPTVRTGSPETAE